MSTQEAHNSTMSVQQIAQKFGLNATYETLEGNEQLEQAAVMELLKYSSQLARDQGGCRFLQQKVEEGKEVYL